MNLLSLLNSRNFITINRPLAHAIGLNPSIMLSELVDKYQYFENDLVQFEEEEGYWFYLKADDVQERTCLSEKEQRSAIETLEKLGFVNKIVRGVPPVRYFKLNLKEIFNYVHPNNDYQFGEKPNQSGVSPNQFVEKAKSIPPKGQIGIGKNTPHPYIQKEQIHREQTNKSASLSALNASCINASLKSKFESLEVEFEDSTGEMHTFDQKTKEAIIRMYSEEEIENAMNFMSDVYTKKPPENPIGLFRRALKEGWTGRTEEEDKCLEYFEQVKKDRKLSTLQAYETHIVDTSTSKDLSFKGMELGAFKRRFNDTFLSSLDASSFLGV